jgi:3-oxoacyl-[acyl-carrier-protein] synthase-3
MACFAINGLRIEGISASVPSHIESNYDLDILEPSERQKLIASIGVENRRVSLEGMTSSDLCFCAAKNLLNSLNWDKKSVECLIFVSQTPDYILPSTSCILQDRLGLSTECFAIDISLGCSGWVYGMAAISSMMKSGKFKRGLLLAGEAGSKLVSPYDRSAKPLFGDAGTATAISNDDSSDGFIFHTSIDGSGKDAIMVPGGMFRRPVSQSSFEYHEFDNGIKRNELNIVLNGMDVFSFAISEVPKSIKALLEYASLSLDDVDFFILHQANKMINETVRNKLKIPKDKMLYSLKDYGNTSSASIPLTIVAQDSDLYKSKTLKCIASGFGVGLSWASIYFTLKDTVLLPIGVI